MSESENLDPSITRMRDKLSYKQHALQVANFKER
jgi:hypothetical protein